MKQKLLFYFFVLFFFSCEKKTEKKKVSIEGTIHNCKRPEIFLYTYKGNNVLKMDSVKIIEDKFTFELNEAVPRGFYRIGFNYKVYFDLILSDEQITFETDFDKFSENVKIGNSPENQIYMEYLVKRKEIGDKIKDVREKASELTISGNEANSSLAELQKEYKQLDLSEKELYKSIIANHKGSFMETVSRVLLTPSLSDFPKYQNQYNQELFFLKDHYFENIDFSNEEITRGPMLEEKYFLFLQNYVEKTPTALQQAVSYILELSSRNSVVSEFTHVYLMSVFKSYQIPEIYLHIAESYLAKFPDTPLALEIKDYVKEENKLATGSFAPELILNDLMDKPVHLTSLRGKYVLLDFWASWCKPCRVENPNVVRLYHKFKDKGFTVYSVSLDVSKDKWLSAIKEDNLVWTHVSDLSGWNSEAAKIYRVSAIPHAILIDRDGKIIAKNIRGEELEKKLEEIFSVRK